MKTLVGEISVLLAQLESDPQMISQLNNWSSLRIVQIMKDVRVGSQLCSKTADLHTAVRQLHHLSAITGKTFASLATMLLLRT